MTEQEIRNIVRMAMEEKTTGKDAEEVTEDILGKAKKGKCAAKKFMEVTTKMFDDLKDIEKEYEVPYAVLLKTLNDRIEAEAKLGALTLLEKMLKELEEELEGAEDDE